MFTKPGFDKTYMALVLTVTNDGDDLTFYESYKTKGTGIPDSAAAQQAIWSGLRAELRARGKDGPTTLKHGDSFPIWLEWPRRLDSLQIDELAIGGTQMYFYERFDAKTVTHVKKALWFCAFFEAGILNRCHDNTL